jgi:signal transduction histidine kinase
LARITAQDEAMAQAATAAMAWTGGMAALLRRMLRDSRFTVPVCILLICGSFAAAAALQMRLDRLHALSQAAGFHQSRAVGIAFGTGRALDRYARMGAVFAGSPQLYRSADLARAEPAITDIAVFDVAGRIRSHLNATLTEPVPPRFAGARTVIPGLLAFRDAGNMVVVAFMPSSLALGSNFRIVPMNQPRPDGITAAVPGWPLWAVTEVDENQALALWTGTLPLYLFVILGPAAAGAWLSVLFVGAFQRHARAARAIRALKSTRPVEARLMVRLANAERGAAEALRSKSEFIAHMSHELRTPLNAVIGFSEIIAEGYYGDAGHPKYSEYARDINSAGRELHGKISDILEFANIEAGRFPLKLEALDLAALAGQCLDEHQGRAFSRRVDLRLVVAEPGQVRADPQAVRRIFIALISNALAYTAAGGTVRADVRFEDGAGIFVLSDTGTGFSAAESAEAGKAFQRFDRAGTVTGSGLGLAISMELARRMGGATRLASAPGSGAVMEVRLPRL